MSTLVVSSALSLGTPFATTPRYAPRVSRFTTCKRRLAINSSRKGLPVIRSFFHWNQNDYPEERPVSMVEVPVWGSWGFLVYCSVVTVVTWVFLGAIGSINAPLAGNACDRKVVAEITKILDKNEQLNQAEFKKVKELLNGEFARRLANLERQSR